MDVMMGTIYGLYVETGDVRYVGKTKNRPHHRLGSHIRASVTGRAPVLCWIRSHIAQGDEIRLCVLERCDLAELDERERHWIAELRPGGRLLNVSNGGDGGYTHPVVWTPEMRSRLSAKKMGVKPTEAHRAVVIAGQARNHYPMSCVACRQVCKSLQLFTAHYSWNHRDDAMVRRATQGQRQRRPERLCVICGNPTNGTRACSHRCGGKLAWQKRRQEVVAA